MRNTLAAVPRAATTLPGRCAVHTAECWGDQGKCTDELLDKNRTGTLTDEESSELDVYERFEHLVRLLKAHVLQKQGV